MESLHQMIFADAARMSALENGSIDLVVTSPPYPMIEMWDDLFCAADAQIEQALQQADTDQAFEKMHGLLDKVWRELRRVVKPGGIVCINIGDATRTIGGRFRLFANHGRIISAFGSLGFDQLPTIIWRKTTNAPNKFMGSGMLPPCAYVTLEHEYVLIFRLGANRSFDEEEEKQKRRQSAYFWEERNAWFSDVWFNLIGASQRLRNGKTRDRSGAYPFELPYRLINMFSVKGDRVLDPFLGTGTTMLAAMCAGRHSVGYEIEPEFQPIILERIAGLPDLAEETVEGRLKAHADFIQERAKQNGETKNHNQFYDWPVITRQESELRLERVRQLQFIGNDRFRVTYESDDRPEVEPGAEPPAENKPQRGRPISKGRQMKMF
ncbi:MAG: site-specific DNA-methyltransferase [Desulfatitalea sp.]|nr:site-specific DNA-methyltransferase [Desulfatitalea sp.]MBI5897114.1 site-specific DNA-methyltransferase [Desulfobacterales bacterium]